MQVAKLIVRNMGLINFALNRTQSFDIDWRGSHELRDDQTIDTLDLSGVQGMPIDEKLVEPVEQAVFYSEMKIRAADHNHPVGAINHTSWMAPRKPLLAADRDDWDAMVTQPTSMQKFKVPQFPAGKDKWAEIVLNNFDDRGHPFHLVRHSTYLCDNADIYSTATTFTSSQKASRTWARL